MADVFTKAKRSEVMSRIRGNGNKDTELALVAVLRRYAITGWRRNQKLVGKPDFVFPVQRLAVFVDGCFWHGCPIHGTKPKANKTFWSRKLAANKVRDRRVTCALRADGWRVLRIWEHELRPHIENRLIRRIAAALSSAPCAVSTPGNRGRV